VVPFINMHAISDYVGLTYCSADFKLIGLIFLFFLRKLFAVLQCHQIYPDLSP